MPWIMLADKFSYYNKSNRYAKRLEEVTVITVSQNVLIVEGTSGVRFPVNEQMVAQVTDAEFIKIREAVFVLNALPTEIKKPAELKIAAAQELKIKQILNYQ